VILREGTDEAFGRGQIISNINSAAAVVDVIKTTLGKFTIFQIINTKKIHLLKSYSRKFYLKINALCDFLGPRGMDKLIHDGRGVTISNDGATLIALLDIVHPAAKTLVDIARSQDNEVGDGTTSVVLVAGELLK
jgi:T-complex protein 1 subunit eta